MDFASILCFTIKKAGEKSPAFFIGAFRRGNKPPVLPVTAAAFVRLDSFRKISYNAKVQRLGWEGVHTPPGYREASVGARRPPQVWKVVPEPRCRTE